MSKYKYSATEQQFNSVLKHQDEELKRIKAEMPSSSELDKRIQESEDLLLMHGYELPSAPIVRPDSKKVIVVPSWEQLCAEAEAAVGTEVALEDLFTEDEIKANGQAIRKLNQEYNQIHHLDK